jgi:putative peptidoglycan lipid II flippase
VYSHTRLRGSDLEATASTLAIFSFGMFAWGAQNILARGFYAARDTLTPAVVGTALTFLNLPLYWLLVKRFQHLGLALASSVGIVAYTVALFVLLNRRIAYRESAGLPRFFLKVGGASVLAALTCYELTRWLGTRIGWQTTPRAFLVLVVVSGSGLVLLAILAKLLRIHEVDALLKGHAPF